MKVLLALVISTGFGPSRASGEFASSPLCFEALPGELDIARDTPGKVAITPIAISKSGAKAFIATEYLGSANLQASVYLAKGNKYCLAGDLGPAVNFRPSPKDGRQGYFGVVVESKSGADHLFRTFSYASGRYALSSCKVRMSSGEMRNCTPNEK